MHFRISSSLGFLRKTKRHVFLLLFVLTPVHLNWPRYATGKGYRSPRQPKSTMKHWWFYITIHFLTIFKWEMRNLRLNLKYLYFFVQYLTKTLEVPIAFSIPIHVLSDQHIIHNCKFTQRSKSSIGGHLVHRSYERHLSICPFLPVTRCFRCRRVHSF